MHPKIARKIGFCFFSNNKCDEKFFQNANTVQIETTRAIKP